MSLRLLILGPRDDEPEHVPMHQGYRESLRDET